MPSPQERDYRLYMVTREPFVPGELLTPPEASEPDWYIVQFNGPLTFDERERLRATYGLRLSDYVPNFAYLEFLRPETLDALFGDEFHRTSVRYEPSDKISPRIAELADEEPASGRLLRAVLLPEADLKNFLDALSAMLTSAGLRDRAEDGSDSDLFKIADDTRAGGSLKVVFPFAPTENLLTLAKRKDVQWIEEAPGVDLDARTAPELTPGGLIQSGTRDQTPIWDKGIQGQGQVIGITDSPVNIAHCMFADSNPVGPNHRKVRGQRPPFNGHDLHGQTVAALAAGNALQGPLRRSRGMAFEAKISLDDAAGVDAHLIPLLDVLMNQGEDGAFIHSNSWHTRGGYDQVAADVDSFVFGHEEHFICGSSGNSEEHKMGPPGSAKNVLCVSATGNLPRPLEFVDGISGPISRTDTRFKPDICATGCGISSAGSNLCVPVSLTCVSSWATPVLAGAAALVRQYYFEGWYPTGTKRSGDEMEHPSAALIKATLLNSTVKIIEGKSYPTRRHGWGLMRLTNTLFFAEEGAPKLFVRDVPNAAGLHTGESHTYNVTVRDDSRPLKITLVWSDSPGMAIAARPLVNDLNLIVTSPEPSRKTFLGNQLGPDGISVECETPDDINNVEMVIRDQNLQGVWTITVFCEAANGRTGTQGYALVVTGALA